MSDMILSNIITALATIIGSYLVFKSNLDKNLFEKNKLYLCKCMKNIKAFYKLEEMYIDEVSKLTNKSKKIIKETFRKQLLDNNIAKPNLTFNNADKFLNEYNCN